MHIFERTNHPIEKSSTENNKNVENGESQRKENPIKKTKKIKIGFRHHKEKKTEEISSETYTSETNQSISQENIEKKTDDQDVLPMDDPVINDLIHSSNNDKENSTIKKRKTFVQKDMKGKPVYLEDTGEKLGTVFDVIIDNEKNLTGYKIKDNKSDSILGFSLDQFDEDKNGLIFVPSWYSKAVKTIEKLEFKDRISPEITTLLSDDAVSSEELYNIFLKHDDEMANYMEETVSLKEMLQNRLKVLEKERLALKDKLIDLTEKRLIKDIDRRQFSEDVLDHRRRANILDVNIKKCKELLQRVDHTSFGMLGNKSLARNKYHEDAQFQRTYEPLKEKNSRPVYLNEIETPYKQKYYELKTRYENLEENYHELKIAVEKLISKQ